MSPTSVSFCVNPGIATLRSFAGTVGETLTYCSGMDCVAEARAPRLAVATGHAAVEAVDPTDVAAEHFDAVVAVAVEAPVD